MKIWAPICSATTLPFSAMEPLAGASMPEDGRMYAVCSVELPNPPHHRIVRFLYEVVEPGLADLPRRELRIAVVVLERPDERERAADVVVGDDQRHVELVVDVVVDLPEALFDAFIGPALEGAA